MLCGQVIDPEGAAIAGLPVHFLRGDGEPITTATTADGKFLFRGVPTGSGTLAVADSAQALRIWATGTAPPGASRSVLMVSRNGIVRGQGDLYQWISEHYILTCCAVAAAIAVPTALIDAGRSKKPSSP
jgi:hypothetical protein